MRARIAVGLCTVLLAVTASGARAQEDCTRIADPNARLACYDARNGAPAVPAPPTVPAQTRTAQTPPPATTAAPPQMGRAPVREAAVAQLSDYGRIASVQAAQHGQWLITLDDGRAFQTTQSIEPPRVGDAVHYRKSFIGTKFLDINGRRPLGVRPLQ